MVMSMDKRCLAILTVACFVLVSMGAVAALEDSDATGGIQVVSYDGRENGGQLMLEVSSKPGMHTASIDNVLFKGNYILSKDLTLTKNSQHDGSLVAGSYPGIELKYSGETVGTFDLMLYNVSFDLNGGTGSVEPFVAYGTVDAPSTDGLSNGDKKLLGWAKSSDATVPEFTTKIDVKSELTLYAVWGSSVVKEATVTVESNDDSMGSVKPTSLKVPYGSEITVEKNVLTINRQKITATPAQQTAQYVYDFSGWLVDGKAFVEGSKVEKDTTITATFVSNVREYTVTVESNDDSMGSVKPTSLKVPYGSEITVEKNVLTINRQKITATPAQQTAQYVYDFSGWLVDGKAFVEGSKVEKDTTITASFTATSTEVPVTSVDILYEPEKIFTTQSIQLSAIVKPDNATFRTVAWSSSNEKVATVDENGVLKALAPGTVTITATAGGVTDSFILTVVTYTSSDVVATVDSKEFFSLRDAVAAAANGGTVVLKKNVDNVLFVEEGQKLTFDMNGFSCAAISNKGSVVVTGNGTIICDDFAIINFGTMEIRNGSFSATSSSDISSPAVVSNAGTMIISGGSFKAVGGFAVDVVSETTKASLTILGGTFEARFAVCGFDSSENYGATGDLRPEISISGGEFTGTEYAIAAEDTIITISGGRFVGGTADLAAVGDSNVKISGGVFPSKNCIETSVTSEGESYELSGSISISGGSFGSMIPSSYLEKGYVVVIGTGSLYNVVPASSSGDDDDDPVPVPIPSQKSDDGDDNSVAIVAVVAGCVAVAIIAILVVAMRKE